MNTFRKEVKRDLVLDSKTEVAEGIVSLTMRDPILRFFVVEHLTGMIIAIALAHIGRARVKKTSDANARHRYVLIFVGLAMVAILLSIPWPGMAGGRELFRSLTAN